MPSRQTIQRRMDYQWAEHLADARNQLLNGKRWCCIQFDGWTSSVGTSYLGIMLTYMEGGRMKNVYPRVVDMHEAQTGANLLKIVLLAVTHEARLPLHRVVCCVTDAARNMQKACDDHPNLRHVKVRCAIHMLMNALKAGDTAGTHMGEVFRAAREFVAAFRSIAVARRRALESLQRAKGIGKPLRLVQDSPTRWMGMYLVLRRIDKMWEVLKDATPADLMMDQQLYESSLGILVLRRQQWSCTLRYMAVAQYWTQLLQDGSHPTASLMTRFKDHMIHAFMLPAERRDGPDGLNFTAVDAWRKAVLASFKERAGQQISSRRTQSLWLAAEYLDPRTHYDIRRVRRSSDLGMARAAITMVYDSLVPKAQPATLTAPINDTDIVPPIESSRGPSAIMNALAAWERVPPVTMQTASADPAVLIHTLGAPLRPLADVSDIVLGMLVTSSGQERAFSAAKRVTNGRHPLLAERGGKFIAMSLHAQEERRRAAAPDPPMVLSMIDSDCKCIKDLVLPGEPVEPTAETADEEGDNDGESLDATAADATGLDELDEVPRDDDGRIIPEQLEEASLPVNREVADELDAADAELVCDEIYSPVVDVEAEAIASEITAAAVPGADELGFALQPSLAAIDHVIGTITRLKRCNAGKRRRDEAFVYNSDSD